jgi:hypothetical protein
VLENFIIERLGRWMPSQQAWPLVPVFSQNLLRCLRGRPRKRGSNLLWGPTPGRVQGARTQLIQR